MNEVRPPDVGDGGQVQKQNPNRNIFARFDAYLPMNTHFVLRHNYASADNTVFSRGAADVVEPELRPDVEPLPAQQQDQRDRRRVADEHAERHVQRVAAELHDDERFPHGAGALLRS